MAIKVVAVRWRQASGSPRGFGWSLGAGGWVGAGGVQLSGS